MRELPNPKSSTNIYWQEPPQNTKLPPELGKMRGNLVKLTLKCGYYRLKFSNYLTSQRDFTALTDLYCL